MSWLDHHRQSEELLFQAEAAEKRGDPLAALDLYREAAEQEIRALEALEPSKTRTRAVSAVGATALYLRARQFDSAENTAHEYLYRGVPTFAGEELRRLLQSIWSERARTESSVNFRPGQFFVSLRGGQVHEGGAPMDLVLSKTKTISDFCYRATEFLTSAPYRKEGAPSSDILRSCRPWLIQAPPASFRFAVAIQDDRQANLFKENVSATEVSDFFFRVVRSGAGMSSKPLKELVSQDDYRMVFLKLARLLTPHGRVYSALEIQSGESGSSLILDRGARKAITERIRAENEGEDGDGKERELEGILRAVDLNNDWIRVSSEGVDVTVRGVGEEVDDVIGPMVNRPVLVRFRMERERNLLVDIELLDGVGP